MQNVCQRKFNDHHSFIFDEIVYLVDPIPVVLHAPFTQAGEEKFVTIFLVGNLVVPRTIIHHVEYIGDGYH